MPADRVQVRVPGKINLHLGVGALRPDGFHELITVFHAVDVVDHVIATISDQLSLAVDVPNVPADQRNLAWRAAVALADWGGVEPHVHLDLRKGIPIAAGMAGGSADAAAALVACAALWGLRPSAAELAELAAGLGSDAPFALLGGTAVGTGRGELLTPVPGLRTHWALVFADDGIGTADAYRELDRIRAAPAPPAPADAVLTARTTAELAVALHNDLQEAALSLRPELRRTLDTGREQGALAGIVSGSGPTCAFLCADADRARRVADAVGGRVATGPAPGATIV